MGRTDQLLRLRDEIALWPICLGIFVHYGEYDKAGEGLVCLFVGLVWSLPGKVMSPRQGTSLCWKTNNLKPLPPKGGRIPDLPLSRPVWGFSLSREVPYSRLKGTCSLVL